jgi:hypothetical protein
MSDIGVEEEVIVIDIESNIADDNNINALFLGLAQVAIH